MYETTTTDGAEEAREALQTALDRRDNGGPAGH